MAQRSTLPIRKIGKRRKDMRTRKKVEGEVERTPMLECTRRELAISQRLLVEVRISSDGEG